MRLYHIKDPIIHCRCIGMVQTTTLKNGQTRTNKDPSHEVPPVSGEKWLPTKGGAGFNREFTSTLCFHGPYYWVLKGCRALTISIRSLEA